MKRFRLVLCSLVILLWLVGCTEIMTTQKDIVTVQAELEAQILDLPGVVGVAVGECAGTECLLVFVEQETPELARQIPQELEGFPVQVQATGPIQAQPGSNDASPSGDIMATQAQLESQVMDLPGVVGIGQIECDGAPCFIVYVELDDPALTKQIPTEINGFKVEIEASGPVQIQTE